MPWIRLLFPLKINLRESWIKKVFMAIHSIVRWLSLWFTMNRSFNRNSLDHS